MPVLSKTQILKVVMGIAAILGLLLYFSMGEMLSGMDVAKSVAISIKVFISYAEGLLATALGVSIFTIMWCWMSGENTITLPKITGQALVLFLIFGLPAASLMFLIFMGLSTGLSAVPMVTLGAMCYTNGAAALLLARWFLLR